jgi:hypothetical protein
MFIATLVISLLFAALLVVSATGKLRRDPTQMATMERVGARRIVPVLATLELAAAAGLAAGLAWWPIGVAAGIGITLYFAGAIIAHLRVHDRGIVAPVVLLVVALVTLALRIAAI